MKSRCLFWWFCLGKSIPITYNLSKLCFANTWIFLWQNILDKLHKRSIVWRRLCPLVCLRHPLAITSSWIGWNQSSGGVNGKKRVEVFGCVAVLQGLQSWSTRTGEQLESLSRPQWFWSRHDVGARGMPSPPGLSWTCLGTVVALVRLEWLSR